VNQRNALSVVLGGIGILSLFLYLLACRPSWSPDGSRILFPIADSTGSGVALADLRSGTVRLLFAEGAGADGRLSESVATVQWSRDGRQAIAVLMNDKNDVTRLAILPVEAGQPARLVGLEDGHLLTGYPLPERDGRVFLYGQGRAAVDLGTGRVTVARSGNGLDEEDVFADWGARVMYQHGTTEDQDGVEFGELGLDSLTLAPLMRLTQADLHAGLAAAGLDSSSTDMAAWLSPEPGGTRVALPVSTRLGPGIVVLGRGAPPRVLRPLPARCALGNLEWSRDGRMLYAAVLTAVDRSTGELCVGEIPLDGGRARLDALARVERDTSWDSGDGFFYQVALSPDGARIATTTARGRPLGQQDRALFLVDLRHDHQVTRIHVPSLATLGGR
jgi:hypothetical protein